MDDFNKHLVSLRALVEWAHTAPDCPDEAQAALLRLRIMQLDLELEHRLAQERRDIRYVYALVDPRDDHIYYVGQSYHPRQRAAAHFQEVYGTSPKAIWIKALRAQGLRPVIRILEACEPGFASADSSEQHWIRSCLQAGEPLTNGLK